MLSALLWATFSQRKVANGSDEKLLTEATPSVKMRLSRPAGRDNREISIEVPLKNSQSEAETIQIVLLFI